ncbi:hypothetical protein AVEN_178815-1 [Araneus ventricosus]|uniref:Uncharacterized protein n=1 Tax=Araneus ventricosus TaxID=182803 RepID=A0A4Y2BFP9_ARAVE|nr:hypothetical protein AVEN_178815-1 [Araneus ventricosus]
MYIQPLSLSNLFRKQKVTAIQEKKVENAESIEAAGRTCDQWPPPLKSTADPQYHIPPQEVGSINPSRGRLILVLSWATVKEETGLLVQLWILKFLCYGS